MWRWCEANLSLFLVISITLSFQIKKIQIPKIFVMWFFVAPNFQQNFEILLLLWTLTTNKFWTKCLRCLTLAQTIIFHPYFMEMTTLMSILLQLSHNGSSKLLKMFSKSFFFFGNFKLLLWFFQKILKSLFLVNLHHFIQHYEARKMKRYKRLKMPFYLFSNPFLRDL